MSIGKEIDKARFVHDLSYRMHLLLTGNFQTSLMEIPTDTLVQLVQESLGLTRRLFTDSAAPMKSLRDILPLNEGQRKTISSPVVPLDLDLACAYFCFGPVEQNPSIPAPWHEELAQYKGLQIVLTFGNTYMWLPVKNEPVLLADHHLREMFSKDPSIAMYCLHAIKTHLERQAAYHARNKESFSDAHKGTLAIINRIGWGS